MADTIATLPNRGKTYLSGDNRTLTSTYGPSAGLEGHRKNFADYAPSSTPGPGTLRSEKMVTCVLVRNASAGALLPKRLVKWQVGYENRRVDGYCTINFERCAGVVDEHLSSAGCPRYDMCWIAVKGPTLCLTDLAGADNNVIAAGQIITALTAATSGATTAGRVLPFAVTTTVTTIMSVAFNKVGRAMSAKTTANTNADVLIDLDIWC